MILTRINDSTKQLNIEASVDQKHKARIYHNKLAL